MTINTNHDFVTESVKAAPPATVVGLSFVGIQLSDVLIILTLVYTAFQLYFLLRDKWWRPRKEKRK